MRSRTAVPIPVPVRAQTPLPGDPHRIRVYRASDWSEVGTCAGATRDGRCSQPQEDGGVPCAGCVLVLPMAVEGSVQWRIPSTYRGCFPGTYAAYSRAPA